MHAVPGGEGATDLWVMRADGSGAVNLTEDLDGNAGAASWSPDGTRLVAALGLYGAYDIYSMAPDGTDRVNLTSTPQQSEGDDESPPQWSPDGAQLLYVRPENGHKNIWVMNADGSEQRNLSHGGSHEEGARWAGDKIVFLRLPGFGGDLWSMNLDGSGQRNLTEDTTEDWAPVVSPDGRRLAWASYADGNREIYTMAVDGSERTRVTSTSASINDDRPAWEPCP
jgi:Tol biopolymer transport system component